jgi:hypothetical protein
MDEATARWYVKHTGGQFQAFERDGAWYLCTPDHPDVRQPHSASGSAGE